MFKRSGGLSAEAAETVVRISNLVLGAGRMKGTTTHRHLHSEYSYKVTVTRPRERGANDKIHRFR